MNTPTKIYRRIKKEMQLDDNALELLGITPGKIETAYNHCIAKGLTDAKAEAAIIQLWKNSKKDVK